MAAREQLDQQAVHPVYVIVWDNVNFHCAVPIRVVHKQPGLHKRFLSTLQPPS